MPPADKSVFGKVVAASPEGFAELLRKANEVHASGLTLVAVVPLDTDDGKRKLGGVFVRLPKQAPEGPPPKPMGSLIDD
jgi:uncharacterized Fe-S cluster-containing radical SAM superfamily protein